MEISTHIFREYDIRGTVGKEINVEFAKLLGAAYGELAAEKGKNNICVGEDCRLSSESLALALAEGITSQGVDVTLTGMNPTSVVYWSTYKKGLGGGIQVTGSHNPPDMNGFKICLGTQTLASQEIQNLKDRVVRLNKGYTPAAKLGKISKLAVREEYIADLVSKCKDHIGKRKLKVVVDAGNGVGGVVGVPALKALGVEVIELFCEPDGNFPNHHPDPTVLKNLKDLIAKVKETKADLGIGWDGDADRIGVVDENGEVIYGDMLLAIYARELLKEVPGATVIGDVKCSSRLFDDVNKHGGKAVMWKTGHSLVKAKLKELHAELAGEMSGHIFFAHRFYGFDCALNCSCRLIEIMSNTDKKASELLSDMPKAYNTPEIRVDCLEEEKFIIVDKAVNAFKEFKTDTTDGVRISFPHGWGLIRASNTQPVLVMRFEADSEKLLEEYQSLVSERLAQIRSTLNA